MFKTKLFASICAAASAVTVAATTATLFIAGPAGLDTIHDKSPNEAVASTIEGLFSSASSSASNITNIINTIATNKTATNIGFTINHIEGYDELDGYSGEMELQVDPDSKAASLILDLAIDSLEVEGATVYIDKEEILASIPSLFDGVFRLGLDNLDYDLNYSTIGEYLDLSYSDIEEITGVYEIITDAYSASLPQFDFDSEKFMEGLKDTMSDSFDEAMKNMEVEDLGKKELNGGKYPAYEAQIPVEDLSGMIKDAAIYCVKSPEFQDLFDQAIDYAEDISGTDISDYIGVSGADLGQLVNVIDSYWDMVDEALIEVIGEDIEMTFYISETLELAGLSIDAYILDDGISFDDGDKKDAEMTFSLMCDYTGGKNIGDYSEINVDMKDGDSDEYISFDYSNKTESNGDFDLLFAFDMTNEDSFKLTANGNHVSNGNNFSLDVDSLKFYENDDLMFDVGFKLGFNTIDSITKPSGSTVYDLFDMDEYDFMELYFDLEDVIGELSDLFY